MSAEIRPTKSCTLVSISLLSLNSFISSSSLPNARITRAPVKFSLVLPSTRSKDACTRLYSGIVTSITPNTTTDNRGIVITNIIAAFTSTVKAIIIAPKTTNGDRIKRRSTMFTPDWSWLTSLVIRVISVDVPISSKSANDNFWICANNALRSCVANPTAAFAAKYCAEIAHTNPITANAIRIPHLLKI